MQYTDYETLNLKRTGKILTVTLNRPEQYNAANALMHQELVRVFQEINHDVDTHVVVLTGAGKAFSAGGDIKAMLKSLDDHQRWAESMREARDLLYAIVDLDRPIIARINGHAVGVGATIALFCDITFAVESALIGDPHVKVGLTAGDGGALIWPLLIGHARAKRLLLTGDTVSAAQAAELGLITEAVPSLEELDTKVDAVAEQLAAGASVAIRTTKRAANMLLRQQLDAVIDGHLGLETLSHLTNDRREAAYAFRDKRKPVFTGT
ncbi:MAG: enoyl-CoA hydratase/isomerase family protein [Halieaceae bacterium]|jgi:enoyl-CoA hydratase|nr:enoyl-CoA hydratase/isomerase family protein [Halieaceae bacterium]